MQEPRTPENRDILRGTLNPRRLVRTRSKNMRVRGGEGLGKLRNIQNVHSEESIP
ncbi:MAG: hypothetical protein ACFN4H_06955 [Prevotella sp.]